MEVVRLQTTDGVGAAAARCLVLFTGVVLVLLDASIGLYADRLVGAHICHAGRRGRSLRHWLVDRRGFALFCLSMTGSRLTHRQAHRAASGTSRQSNSSSTTLLFIVQLGNAGLILTELDVQNVERLDHKQAFGQVVDVTGSIDELPLASCSRRDGSSC
eukprot:scaffold264869_cov19-Prasinocladus_malaysianus.AAC.2